jgi:glutathione S-transferase
LALAEEWQQALADGVYRRSTRGLALEQVGFLHASRAEQIAATFERFYADAGPVRLLSIDPQRLGAAGLVVREEPAPESGELFPHLYGGPLPCEAVVAAEPYRP